MSWVITTPCWGDYHVGTFTEHTLPALRVALAYAQIPYRLIIHTDSPEKLANLGVPVTFRPLLFPTKTDKQVETGLNHEIFGCCHREAIDFTEVGERLMFLNADIILSREVFTASEARFEQGKKLIMCAASRHLLKAPNQPPIGSSARNLLDWGSRCVH